jgi:sulfur carrier protein
MDVTVNGEPRALGDGMTVSDLLRQLAIVPERVVVEVNLKILKRAEHPQVTLSEGDRVEIVHLVGGGR